MSLVSSVFVDHNFWQSFLLLSDEEIREQWQLKFYFHSNEQEQVIVVGSLNHFSLCLQKINLQNIFLCRRSVNLRKGGYKGGERFLTLASKKYFPKM